ncbi:MAG: peptide deformylase [Chthoniobacterales bacterium]
MILDIVTYGHPALRSKGRLIEKVDDKILELADDMIDTMDDAEGLGLAAQQVGMSLQMTVLDIPPLKKRPSKMWIDNEEVDFTEWMPMVLLNAEVEKSGETITEAEGCLSFPGLQADIPRPERVRVKADLLDGSRLEFEAEGLLARAVQHEHDHLHGILFIDRMTPEDRKEIAEDLAEFERNK